MSGEGTQRQGRGRGWRVRVDKGSVARGELASSGRLQHRMPSLSPAEKGGAKRARAALAATAAGGGATRDRAPAFFGLGTRGASARG